MAVVAGIYRTRVIDEVVPHSPAEYVRLPNVPPESPTLGLAHLQFEAMLTAAGPHGEPASSPTLCVAGQPGAPVPDR